jgi:hypothetical protein
MWLRWISVTMGQVCGVGDEIAHPTVKRGPPARFYSDARNSPRKGEGVP